MRTTIIVSSGIVLLACSAGDPAPTMTSTTATQSVSHGSTWNSQITRELQPLVAAYRAPGVSVLAVQGDDVIYKHAFGLANVEAGQEMSLDTPVQVASIAKLIAATALMQLYEQGKFGLDDDVGNYLSYPVRNPTYPDTIITIRMILSHSSSINDNWGVANYYFGSPPPQSPSQYGQSYFDPFGTKYSDDNYVNAEPGTVDNYANTNFVLVGALIEALSGQSLEAYTEEHIFAPLNMKAVWNVFSTETKGLAAPPAMPYIYDPTSDSSFSPGLYTQDWYPATGLTTDAMSLSHFLIAMMNGGVYRGTRIIKASTMALMQTNQNPSLGVDGGLGYEIVPPGWYDADNTYVGHLGGDLGFVTSCFYRPSDGRGVIVFANGDAGFDFGEKYQAFVNMMLVLFDAPAKPKLADSPVKLVHF